QRRLQAGRAHDGDDDDVGLRESGQLDQAFRSRENFGARAKQIAQLPGFKRIADREGFGPVFAGLLDEQRKVVARPEPEEPDAIGEILGHLHRAGADGSSAAQYYYVLHGRVKMWRRYKYIMGALNSRLSSKSRMPPIPG